MITIGKELRLRRIFRRDGRSLIVAMDHNLFGGPVPGLEKPADVIRKVIRGGADAIMATFGVIKQFREELADRNVGVIWSILPDTRYVELAARLGVDAVKITYFTSMQDREVLGTIGTMAAECEKWGMPLLVEIVPTRTGEGGRLEILHEAKDVKAAARYAAEQGADFVKTLYTGSIQGFKEVVENCPVPIVILGGAKMKTDEEVLAVVKDSIEAGGAGIAFGRNIWQHRDPVKITRAIAMILHEGASIGEALKELQ